MKVTFRHNVYVNEEGQVSTTIELIDTPGVSITIPPVTLTRAQSGRLAGMVLWRQGMVCAHCGKAPPLVDDTESGRVGER